MMGFFLIFKGFYGILDGDSHKGWGVVDFEILGESLNFDFDSESIFSYVENRIVKYKPSDKVQVKDEVSIVVINELFKETLFYSW